MRFHHGMTSHLQAKQANFREAASRHFQAQTHVHWAIKHNIKAYLCQVQGKALHNEAVVLEDEVQAEDLAFIQEEHEVKEYEELFEKAQQAIQECEKRIQNEEEISEEAHQQAQAFLDEMYSLEYEFAQTCAQYRLTENLCEAVARWNGIDKQEKSLALDALSKEEAALLAEKKEDMEEEQEKQLEKNATVYEELVDEAEQNATLLRDEYKMDEVREEDLESNATALFHMSATEREMGTAENAKAKQDWMEELEFKKTAKFHQKRARWCAVFAVLTTVAVLYVFVDYLILLLKRRRPTADKLESSGIECDASTVASSVASEGSPLMEDASVVESGSNDSYTTIDLASRNTVSSLSDGSISQFFHYMSVRIQSMAPAIQRLAPKIEFVAVLLVVIFSAHLLFREIFPTCMMSKH